MDEPVPSSTGLPPAVTSDCYMDGVNPQTSLDNLQIAQDNLLMVPPTAALPGTNVPVHTAVATSNQTQVSTREGNLTLSARYECVVHMSIRTCTCAVHFVVHVHCTSYCKICVPRTAEYMCPIYCVIHVPHILWNTCAPYTV